MVQTAEKLRRYDCADGLNGPTYWRILVQSEVGPHQIMILLVGTKDMAQMSLIEDDDMVDRPRECGHLHFWIYRENFRRELVERSPRKSGKAS